MESKHTNMPVLHLLTCSNEAWLCAGTFNYQGETEVLDKKEKNKNSFQFPLILALLRLERPICALPPLSAVSLGSPCIQFQCKSECRLFMTSEGGTSATSFLHLSVL